MLDDYFDRVTELIVSHGGMVDKMFGDAVLCFFNIPADLPGHTEAAVRCARAIVASTEAFPRRREVAALGFGRTRCGIETGMAIVGDVGGRRRLDYTVYGPVVNKAARFQEANKALKSTICVGPTAAYGIEERHRAALARPHRCPRHGGLRGGLRAVGGRRSPRHPEELRRGGRNSRSRARPGTTDIRPILPRRRPEDQVVKMWLDRLAR